MPGTIIKDLKLSKVVDGDTINVWLNGREESLRLICLDTEESWDRDSKPVTNAGLLASKWAKEFFDTDEQGIPQGDILVDLEFDTNDPISVCLRKHRGNYGRLLCYIHNNNENYNLRVVSEGWSPYFIKYGRSRLYHTEFMQAEAEAQSKNLGIWNYDTNAGGNYRNYRNLIPWWYFRDSVVQNYRQWGQKTGVLSVRLDYEKIVEAAKNNSQISIFCDLQGGIDKWAGDGALIYVGSTIQKFNLWIPDQNSDASQKILGLIKTRYAGYGRNYVYVSGIASLYPPHNHGTPQIVLTDVNQLADVAPGR